MKRWIDLTVGALVSISLLAAAGFFYVEIRRDEAITAQYGRTVEAIQATRVLASQWGIEVEKVRNEVNSNFDVLAGFIDRMERHVAVIRETPRVLPLLPASVKWSLNGYVQRLKAQEERIERFKSGFAIVRNSRRFIPREGAELAEAARDGGHGKVEAATRRIMAETEEFLGRPNEVQRQRMERTMRVLAESARGTALRTQADTLNKHVRALLRHYGLTEQRFRDIMGSDLEGRAEQAADLLDSDHARGRAMRRWYDYGLLLALGLAVTYWGFLAMRWMGGRRRRRAAERVPEAALQERLAPTLDVEAAWAAAGVAPGTTSPGTGPAEPQEPPAQARHARERRAGQARAKFAASGRSGLSLAERLRARDGGARPAQRREPGREGGAAEGGAPIPDARAGGPVRAGREEPVDGADRLQRASDAFARAGAAPAAWDAGRTAGEHPDRVAEQHRKAEDGIRPAREGDPLALRLEALARGIPTTREEPAMGPDTGPWRDAGRTEPGPAPADGGRTFEGQAQDRPPAPDAERTGGAHARWIGATRARAAPDGSGLVHHAIREVVLERLQEVEREIRAAADAAEQAGRGPTGGNGEGRQEAWAAAAGRMAGVRWEVRTLLDEAGRLPCAPAPSGTLEPIVLGALLDARLDALAAEDRERIDAAPAPQAVTRGDPRALEGLVDLVLRHALDGARLHPGGQGRVTVTLSEEHDGVHLACLGHGPGNEAPGERPGLVLAAARRLAGEQDATMEVVPYPGRGTMIRLRLPLHRSRAARHAPGAEPERGEEGRDGAAAPPEGAWPHE